MTARLLELSPEQLSAGLESRERARAVYRSLKKGRDPFRDPDLPLSCRGRLKAVAEFAPLRTIRCTRAPDGATKLVFGLDDGQLVEGVLIPERRHSTVCVSSQVGCLRGCSFCRTAASGWIRNLTCTEIVGQVLSALALVEETRAPELRNIVFMGMGEPLDNLDEVRRALDLLVSPQGLGFGPRHVTVSTVGPSPSIVRRAAGLPAQLAWSLHSAIDETRRHLVPTQRFSVRFLRDAFADLCTARRSSLFVALTLLSDVNDGERDADELIRLFHGFPGELRFNLLPWNQTQGLHQTSPRERVLRFQSRLREAGFLCFLRTPRGAEESAACGQLAHLALAP